MDLKKLRGKFSNLKKLSRVFLKNSPQSYLQKTRIWGFVFQTNKIKKTKAQRAQNKAYQVLRELLFPENNRLLALERTKKKFFFEYMHWNVHEEIDLDEIFRFQLFCYVLELADCFRKSLMNISFKRSPFVWLFDAWTTLNCHLHQFEQKKMLSWKIKIFHFTENTLISWKTNSSDQ